jgi:superfamily I DNA/RNA helicase
MAFFKDWFYEAILWDFLHNQLQEVFVFDENQQDLSQQGYRKITAKFGPNKGQLVWWKQGSPPILAQDNISQPISRPNQSSTLNQQDLSQQGYRKIIAKFGPNTGEWIWWKPGSPPILAQDNVVGNQQLKPKLVSDYEKQVEPNIGRMDSKRVSDYQKQIESTFLNTKNDIIISALAGTGKTTMLRHLASYKKTGEKWLYLVFNKKNQVEATKGKSRFASDVEVKTTHSFLGTLLDNNSKQGVLPTTSLFQKDKSSKIGELLESGNWFESKARDLDVPMHFWYALKTRVKKLASLAKSFAIHVHDAASEKLLIDLIRKYAIDTTLTEGSNAYRQQEIDYTYAIVDLTLDLLHMSMPNGAENPQFNSVRDHDDTLWWAATHANEIRWPHYDVVLADEIQDFNKCQQIMLQKLKQAGARIIGVGDKNQSIYSFRGADSQSFDTVHGHLGSATLHELPTNYRCGKKIIDFVNANTHVNKLKAGVDFDGEVTTNRTYQDSMDQISQEWQNGKQLGQQTAVICRTNKPLVHSALNLLKSHVPFVIIGRDLSEDLVKFIKQVTGVGRRAQVLSMQNFGRAMHDYIQKKENQFIGRINKAQELADIRETGEALDSVLEYLNDNGWKNPQNDKQIIQNSDDFLKYIKQVFSGLNVDENERDAAAYDQLQKNPKGFVNLTTAHRSKGLEFERVFVLRNDLFPHPSAKTPDEIQSEKNAQYVAYTRAMKELHVLNDPEPGGKKD